VGARRARQPAEDQGLGARKTGAAEFEAGQMPLHMRLPKLRGFKNPFRVEYQVVNLSGCRAVPRGWLDRVDDLVGARRGRAGAPVKILGSARSASRSR